MKKFLARLSNSSLPCQNDVRWNLPRRDYWWISWKYNMLSFINHRLQELPIIHDYLPWSNHWDRHLEAELKSYKLVKESAHEIYVINTRRLDKKNRKNAFPSGAFSSALSPQAVLQNLTRLERQMLLCEALHPIELWPVQTTESLVDGGGFVALT